MCSQSLPLSSFVKGRKKAAALALAPVAVTEISIAVIIFPKIKNKKIPRHEGFLLSLMSNEIRYTIIATTYGIIVYAKNSNIVKTGGHAS